MSVGTAPPTTRPLAPPLPVAPPALLAATTHRPWHLPRMPWLMAQSWHDLLFIHYPLDPAQLAPHIPAGLRLDTFAGQAWLAVVPFWMSGVRPRWLPAVPPVSRFLELNLRTYVTDAAGSKPGVWFFSLEASNPLAVWVARSLFHLPYMHAQMLWEGNTYASVRTHAGEPPARFVARYAPSGAATAAAPGTLVHWLTERYCLYTRTASGHLLRGNIHHLPWVLQPATLDLLENTLAAPYGIELPTTPPLLHFARRLDVLVWALEPVS